MNVDEIRALGELGLNVEGYHRLKLYMMIESQSEVERLKSTPRITFEVRAMAEYLNERKKLPEKYKYLVKEYKGFDGVDLESEYFSF